MSNNSNSSQFKSPTDIARETFRRLALERIAPTPDAYRKLYLDISGEPDEEAKKAQIAALQASEAEAMLTSFASSLQKSPPEIAMFGQRLSRAVRAKDWEDYSKSLNQLVEKLSAKPATPPASKGISLVDDIPPPAPSLSSGISLVDSFAEDEPMVRILKDSLYRTLSLALTSLLQTTPKLAADAEALGTAVKEATNENSLNQVAARLKQLCFQIELKSGDSAEQQELLLRLFSLLLENVHELLDHDNWLRGQIEVVQNLISGPIDHRALQDATRSLKDVIYKQAALKNSIAESQSSVKNMMTTFIDRLEVIANSTGNYHAKMDGYSKKISQAKDGLEVGKLVSSMLDETKLVQSEAIRSRDMMLAAQKEVKEAEDRIKELEEKLAHMSELVREDELTGSLNRRGLDDVFDREADRADRRGTPLCAAMLDLDNFKKLNDMHGHAAGDEALVHLVRIVKQTLRSIDVIARYGGEEFLIVMPETNLDEAAQAMTRVQRELTKHFFLVNNERLLITFSAGVALREPRETQESVVKRADKAMYEAKNTGKNRVIKAD
ncbi:GGDEF domain-containing protein [Undibacterium terreum]|uniref:diguanylate cyclase n=1 Tax=Undibacterium terreum TaxID=1224302 RepID=A0A916V0T3_9BURK|nr:GGDEF domain-containing protein [Undibacterium terreum]GGC99920.1 GGDEF domain-containing protein [Undibacterium terreum]